MIVVSKISPMRLSLLALAVAAIACFTSQSAMAQFDGGGLDGGGLDGGLDGGGDFDGGVDDGGGGGGGTGGGADGELDTVEPIRIGAEIEDLRNQGFVGPSAPLIDDTGFVGPASENNTLGGLGEDRFIGGGVNAGLGGRTATTSSADLQDNGFTVNRRGLRAKLVPSFAAPQTPGWVTESRFQSRMSRQPVVRNMGSGVTVTVQNRRAILSGTVGSEAERNIIKRQLRLEPGIYGIDDQTSIAN